MEIFRQEYWSGLPCPMEGLEVWSKESSRKALPEGSGRSPNTLCFHLPIIRVLVCESRSLTLDASFYNNSQGSSQNFCKML